MRKSISPKRRHSGHARRDAADAFLPDPASGTFISWTKLDEAESVAEEYIASVTSAYSVNEEARNELSFDEIGGPFVDDLD